MEQGYVKSVVWHLRQNFIIILPVNYPSAFADIVLVHFQIIGQDHINQTLVTAPNSSEWRTSALHRSSRGSMRLGDASLVAVWEEATIHSSGS